ncbi:MAG TPA: hypothetical protein VE077_06535 [Candidatus Methylomirabilis sp.]|nr:hypothetical protein [Candidatus Methylomirabilis sp.]
MIRHFARTAIVALLAVALLFPPPFAVACGPDFSAPTYTDFHLPDLHDLSYTQGKLGILQSGFFRIYLYEAYRNLSGKPFNSAELAALRELHGVAQPDSAPPQNPLPPPKDWVTEWRTLRATFLGEKPKQQFGETYPYGIFRYEQTGETYRQYPNCLNSAFENAVHTMQDLAKKYGSDSAVLKEWIAAQDQVFENCGKPLTFPISPNPAVIPVAARAEDPADIRADRAYQIAAAHFYAGEFEAAQLAFEQIAKDPVSPYSRIAPYLEARVLIRQATLKGEDEEFDAPTLAEAETKLRAILANNDYGEYHAAAERLLNFISVRLHRQQRLGELESTLSAPSSSKTFGQDLTDYLWLLDRPVLTKTVTVPPASPGQPPQKGVTLDESSRLKGSDMTDWIFNFHEAGPDATAHAIQRWRETNSLPWLVSAISKVDPKDGATPGLLAAASKIAPDSPGYLTVAFHRFRLLEQSGNLDAARRDLDQLLAQSKSSMPISARNESFALRMKLAANLSELLQFGPRISTDAASVGPIPAGQSDYTPGSPEYAATRPHFDSDAAVILTQKLPLRLVADAAKSNALPAELRTNVAIAAWTRAILLKNDAVANEMTPILGDLLPEVKPALAEYAAAPAGDQRDFTAAFEILHNPGFRPFVSASPGRGWFYSVNESRFSTLDEFEDNWWCAFPRPNPPHVLHPGGIVASPHFLSEQDRAGAGKESAALVVSPSADQQPDQPDAYFVRDYYRMFSTLSQPLQLVYPGGVVSSPHFLSADERAAAEKETAALAALPSAPLWLGQTAIAWAKAHPEDSRVPEALHQVVSAWRYGCTESSQSPVQQTSTEEKQGNAPNYSKEAFEILHRRYPESEWTKKTPYWFK